jgi:ElaB/YqjD/DUF883 family membrane-anchored ribosome-binding protein
MSTSTEKVRPAGIRKAPTTEKASETAHDAIDTAAAKARAFEREVRNRAAEAGEKIDGSTAAARARVDKSLSDYESYVREKPVASVGLAFAAGALAGWLLRR